MSRSFLLTWNPGSWQWDDLAASIGELDTTGQTENVWSCGVRRDLPVGSRFFLMRLGENPKGIVGAGITTSDPFDRPHWNDARAANGDLAISVDILFNSLSRDPQIPLDELRTRVSSEFDWTPQASGTELPPDVAERLEALWTEETGDLVVLRNYSPLPNRRFAEGNSSSVTITRYERDPAARSACIAYYGPVCQICGIDFSTKYGPVASGFIHVHHLNPVSVTGATSTDPINDLRPVCPNCHLVIHRRRPPYSIDEMKEMIKNHESQ